MSNYTGADLAFDLVGRVLEETKPDPDRDHRRAYATALLAITPKTSNALVARLLDHDRVILTLAFRSSDGSVHTGETIIPRKAWSATIFERYARTMGRRAH